MRLDQSWAARTSAWPRLPRRADTCIARAGIIHPDRAEALVRALIAGARTSVVAFGALRWPMSVAYAVWASGSERHRRSRMRKRHRIGGPPGPRRPHSGGSGAAHEPPDGGHQFVGLGVALVCGGGTHHAVVGVVVEQPERDLVERRLGGADLGEDIDAVAVVLDHALDAPDLSLDALQACQQLRPWSRCSRALVPQPWSGSYRRDTPTP